jgi:nicotinamide-nucleotide amidase
VTDEIIELAARAGRALQAKGWVLATAESCTGGGLAQAITEVAGASEWFERGYVTYSNAAKTAMLGVPASLIERFGAVSEQVAAAMAHGAWSDSGAQIAISTTGIAGPGGAVPGKPVGTVCFGWTMEGATATERLVFAGDRRAVREQSIVHALRGVLRRIGDAR